MLDLTVGALVLLSFCNGLQMSIYYSTLWPYITTVDTSVTIVFFGYITSAFSVGQCISSILLGFWLDYSKSASAPLILALFLLAISNIIFCVAELFPFYGKWILLTSRLFLGLGSGARTILRAVIPSVSSRNDIGKVISMVQGSYILGTTFGPLLQFSFTRLGPPNSSTFLKIDMYNTGAILMFFMNMILIVPVGFLGNKWSRKESKIDSTLSGNEGKIHYWNIVMCIVTVFMAQLISANIDSTLSPYSELMWHWSKEEIVKYTGYFHSLHGFVQILAFILFSTKFDHVFIGFKSIPGAAFSLFLGILFYFFTFPYPFGDVLNCTQYSWCNSTTSVNLYLFAFSFIVVLAFCYPIITITTNIIFNDSIGNHPQGTLQGLWICLSNFAKVIGPMLLTHIFDSYGPRIVNIFMIFLLILCASYWVISYVRRGKNFQFRCLC